MSTLQPGQLIRPQTTPDDASRLICDLYGLKVTSIKELNSYDDRNYFVKVSSEHENPHLTDLWPHGYIFKVLNSMDSPKNHVDAEHEMQRLLHGAGVSCPQPVLDLQGRDKSRQRISVNNNNKDGCVVTSEHLVRLLTFLPGKTLASVPYKPALMFSVGEMLGRIDKALEGYSHPVFANHLSVWNLACTPKLREFVYAVSDPGQRALVEEVVAAFELRVLPNLQNCTASVIHGDYNEQNIIVREAPAQEDLPADQRDYVNQGVIDFGDASQGYLLFEVAICMMYMMVESHVVDPMLVGGHVLAGYLRHISLSDMERDLLKETMAARFCQSLVMGAYTYSQDPGNEYLLVTAKNGWRLLRQLWDTPKEKLYADWQALVDSYQN